MSRSDAVSESNGAKPRVALLGLGVMGTGMAHSLLRAGFPLTVYNRNPAKAASLVTGTDARTAATPGEAASDADIIVSMVADDAASRAVWLGTEGALAGAKAGAVLIESSTVTAAWIRELADAVHARPLAGGAGLELLDAPVTGTRPHAEAGELLFLVGGSAAALERARPALTAMSRAIVHVGPTGSGALLKLVNNFVCGVQAVALAEALTLVERSGLDRDKALDLLTNGAAGSPLVKTLSARMTSGEFTPPNFTLQLMTKDMVYAQREAARSAVTLDTAACAQRLFERAIADGHAEEDFSSVVESVRQR
jgi:3-hydroxyisobutyrate dehydrogenase